MFITSIFSVYKIQINKQYFPFLFQQCWIISYDCKLYIGQKTCFCNSTVIVWCAALKLYALRSTRIPRYWLSQEWEIVYCLPSHWNGPRNSTEGITLFDIVMLSNLKIVTYFLMVYTAVKREKSMCSSVRQNNYLKIRSQKYKVKNTDKYKRYF